MEALKTSINKGEDANLFFYLDNKGHKVDLFYSKDRNLKPVEIKSLMTYNDTLMRMSIFCTKL